MASGKRILPLNNNNREFPYDPIGTDSLIPRIFPVVASEEHLVKGRTYEIIIDLLIQRNVLDADSDTVCSVKPIACLAVGEITMASRPIATCQINDFPVGSIEANVKPIASVVCQIT